MERQGEQAGESFPEQEDIRLVHDALSICNESGLHLRPAAHDQLQGDGGREQNPRAVFGRTERDHMKLTKLKRKRQ